MTALDLDAIEARANAATEGPWRIETAGNYDVVWADVSELAHIGYRPEDGVFIVAAREDVPALVSEVRRLQFALTEAQKR